MKVPKFPADKTRNYQDVEREARRIRLRLGFDPEEPLPGLDLFQRIDRMGAGPDFSITTTYGVSELFTGVEGETRYVPERDVIAVLLSEAAYDGLERNVPRDRYTAVHEISHAAQHYNEVIRLSSIPHTTAALLRGHFNDLPAFADVEWQADACAGALLMPAKALWHLELRNALSTDVLCRRFGVSPPAASKRIKAYLRRKEKLVW